MEHFIPVKGHPDYIVSNYGTVINLKHNRKVIPHMNTNGYLRVFIDGKKIYLHRIVADSFFEGDHSELDVNHIDGDKTNNCVGNLEWCTRKENIRHAMDTGLFHITKKDHPPRVRITYCKDCDRRGDFPVCSGKDDYFYCAYGKKRRQN